MPVGGEHANETRAWPDSPDVLLTGVMNTVELTYPRLVEQGQGGSIVIIFDVADNGLISRVSLYWKTPRKKLPVGTVAQASAV